MSNNGDSPVVNRRDVLRSGAVVGGGILASVIPGGSAAASDHGQTGAIGYLSRSSYRKLVGTDDVDCVPNVDGWGDTFYVERAAEDSGGETGVSVAVPDAGGGSNARYQAYTITADETVELAGGPSGHGPWQQPCGSWLFVDSDHSLETGSVYRVTEAQGPGLPESCQEGIRATDSDGEPIGAPMEIMRVTYEPVPPAEQWRQVEMLANGGEDAGFGTAIAIDGTTAVVGASGEGAAYVYTLTDDGWTQQTKLGEAVEIIGRQIAISGETILVDAPGAGIGDNDSVCVFTRSDGRWQRQATLEPADPDSEAAFASSFDIDGDTAVVGAPDADGTSGNSIGTVSVFTRTDGNWRRDATLEDTRSDVDDDAQGLGYSVAIDGDTVVAGAPYTNYYDYGYAFTGGAFVFTRAGETWTQQAFLRSETPDNRDNQGRTVAITDDTAVVASHYADTAADDAGAVWVYSRDESEWHKQATLTPDEGERRTWFGYSISLDCDRLLVGSDIADGVGNDAQGSAFVFTRDGTDWRQLVKLTADDGDAYDKFGYDVSLAGDTAFVGAADDADPGGADSGSAYVFQR